jgi:Domain of unknown function (DUF1736).
MGKRTSARMKAIANAYFEKSTASLVIFIISIALYLQPICTSNNNPFIRDIDLIRKPIATLDEIYFTMSGDNEDVKKTNISKIFQNDYWGRPMSSSNSHKSYRPFTVLSFRAGYLLADVLRMNGLFVQRVLNIVLHSVIVQMVGILYQLIFKSDVSMVELVIVRGLFLLHPTHIESVVNIANRAHLLSLTFTLLSLDLNMNSIYSCTMYALALLSCETAIFAFPAVCVTWFCIDRINVIDEKQSRRSLLMWCKDFRIGRITLLSAVITIYLFIRYKLDWIDIPRDLIRRAENPFYNLQGLDRVLNYSHILSIHVVKCLGMGVVDMVGFSHEYGFDCVPRIESWYDRRLVLPFMLSSGLVSVLVKCSRRHKRDMKSSHDGMLLFVAFAAWMATLFPVSGFIRVGTFIADRIVIASTVAGSILWTKILKIVTSSNTCRPYGGIGIRIGNKSRKYATYVLLAFLSRHLWLKIQRRSEQWMFPVTLLLSSLETCPLSAKSNLEMSKVYSSGLFGFPIDSDTALEYAEKARGIDPDYCDVYLQLAKIYVQKNRILDFEEAITKGVICPFTMHDAYSIFQQYWSNFLSDPKYSKNIQIKQRYNSQLKIIQIAIEQEKQAQQLNPNSEMKDRIPVHGEEL